MKARLFKIGSYREENIDENRIVGIGCDEIDDKLSAERLFILDEDVPETKEFVC